MTTTVALVVISVVSAALWVWAWPRARENLALRLQVSELKQMLAVARRDLLPHQQRIAALERQIDNQPVRQEPDAGAFAPDGDEAAAFRARLEKP